MQPESGGAAQRGGEAECHEQRAAGAVDAADDAGLPDEAAHAYGEGGVEPVGDQADRGQGRHNDEHLRRHRCMAVDEERQEQEEEGDALGVEGGDDEGVGERAQRAARRGLGFGERRRLAAPEADAEPDEIGGTEQLEHGEDCSRGGEQRAEPGHGQGHRNSDTAGGAQHHRIGGTAAVADGVGGDEQHRRTRDAGDDGEGGDEAEPEMQGHGVLRAWR